MSFFDGTIPVDGGYWRRFPTISVSKERLLLFDYNFAVKKVHSCWYLTVFRLTRDIVDKWFCRRFVFPTVFSGLIFSGKSQSRQECIFRFLFWINTFLSYPVTIETVFSWRYDWQNKLEIEFYAKYGERTYVFFVKSFLEPTLRRQHETSTIVGSGAFSTQVQTLQYSDGKLVRSLDKAIHPFPPQASSRRNGGNRSDVFRQFPGVRR